MLLELLEATRKVVNIDEVKIIRITQYNPEIHNVLRTFFSSSGTSITSPVPEDVIMAKGGTGHFQPVSFDKVVAIAKKDPDMRFHFNTPTRTSWVKAKNVFIEVEDKK